MKRIPLILIIAMALINGAIAMSFYNTSPKPIHPGYTEEFQSSSSVSDNSQKATIFVNKDNQVKDEIQDLKRLKTLTYKKSVVTNFLRLKQFSDQILRKYNIIEGIGYKRMSFLEDNGYYLFCLRKLLI